MQSSILQFLFVILTTLYLLRTVDGWRKYQSQSYQNFFNRPESNYQSRQAMNHLVSNKWSFNSNQQPSNYGWNWNTGGQMIANSFQMNNNNQFASWSCGHASITNRFPKIMGGQDSAPYSYPWMVSLAKRSYNNLHLCGGTLITFRHVLTAAHCIEDFSGVNDISILAGIHNINEKRNPFSAIAVNLHPQYDPETFANDIAIVTLATPVPSNDPRIGVICLPPDDVVGRNYPPTQSSAVAIGWGSTFFGGNPSQSLKQVLLPILDVTRWPCNIYATYEQGQLCAGQLSGGVDTCQADSGGPLMLENSNRQWEIVGITSFGKSCGKPNTPGIYTRVATYNGFIRSIIGFSKNGQYSSSSMKIDSFNGTIFRMFFLLLVFLIDYF